MSDGGGMSLLCVIESFFDLMTTQYAVQIASFEFVAFKTSNLQEANNPI